MISCVAEIDRSYLSVMPRHIERAPRGIKLAVREMLEPQHRVLARWSHRVSAAAEHKRSGLAGRRKYPRAGTRRDFSFAGLKAIFLSVESHEEKVM
jgi:hypothetical protein